MMMDTFIPLVVGHLLGDFVLQSDTMVRRKAETGVLLLHALIVTVATTAVLGAVPVAALLVFITHVAIDWVKVHLMPRRGTWFLVDQGAHLVALLVIAWVFREAAWANVWVSLLWEGEAGPYRRVLAYVGGFVLCVPAGGALIGAFFHPLTEQVKEIEMEGLRHGGRYIGWLERSLIFLLLVMGYPEGIGFLFAAKSIFRFGEIKEPRQRKLAEYIIIGSFMSFGWALLSAHLTGQLLVVWVE